MIYFISDTHFGHPNILGYCNRPFYSVSQMGDTLISNWNAAVDPEDTVYHLGDFGFYSHAEEVVSKLNGNIHLIKGNHDSEKVCAALQPYLTSISSDLTLNYGDFTFFLQHKPPATIQEIPTSPNSHILSGHTHDKTLFFTPNLKTFNLSVERTDYKPVPITEIISYLTRR